MAMKEENKEPLEKMHEMETQLHNSNETLAKMHEMEIQIHDARKPLPSMCMKIRYENQVYPQFPLKMNFLVFFKDTLEK